MRASASDIETGDASSILGTSLWAVLFVSLASVLGLGIGMVARHSTTAISGLLAWWLVVENLLNAFLDPRFSRLLPFVAGNGLLPLDDPAASVETTGDFAGLQGGGDWTGAFNEDASGADETWTGTVEFGDPADDADETGVDAADAELDEAWWSA